MDHKRAEKLASSILQGVEDALCVKLKELASEIAELRDYFKTLRGSGETVAGCRTWAQFCEQKLHRTDRAVRMLLAEETSASRVTPKPKTKAEKKADLWDRAKKGLSKVLLITDNTEDLERKLLKLLTELFPDRTFLGIAIKETASEVDFGPPTDEVAVPKDSKPVRRMSKAAGKKFAATQARRIAKVAEVA